MSRQTPSTTKKRGTSSSFPSDRLPSRPASAHKNTVRPSASQGHLLIQQNASDAGGTGKGKKKAATGPGGDASGPPKSKQVRRLETLLKSMRHSTGQDKDPKGGCFCLARDHALSPYARICQSCGLVLCSLNLPQYACPFCSEPLLSLQAKEALIAELEQQITDVLKREAEERERAAEEARRAAGAFPTLSETMQPSHPQHRSLAPPPSSSSNALPGSGRQNLPPLSQESHKVLSLRTKPGSNKVVISSYAPTPAASRPASRGSSAIEERGEGEEEDLPCVPPPRKEPSYAKRKADPNRPWENLLGERVTYVHLKSRAS
ncbi:hypothetical protein AX17_007182 [Amanita inopinata Kibby_2008]|nr:hypothetical protein AX17_007182 [Amanita inopinata Kibby_2008]